MSRLPLPPEVIKLVTQLDLIIGNKHIPTVTRPKILEDTSDNMVTFCAHGKSVLNKMQPRTNILKSPAGSSWGKDKETLTITNSFQLKSIMPCHLSSTP